MLISFQESATTHLNAEFEKLNEYKQMINTQNKDIADIKMRIGEKEGGINLHKKNIRLHKKSKVKHIAELEADLQIPPDDQSYNFEKRYTLHLSFYGIDYYSTFNFIESKTRSS